MIEQRKNNFLRPTQFFQLILATVVAAKPSAGHQVDASAIPVLGEAAFRSLAVALGALGAGRQTGPFLFTLSAFHLL